MFTKTSQSGGYRYIPVVFQYSGGVAAEPGHRLERARFSEPVPLALGFARIKAHLGALGRPLTAFAQCELRSPAPFSEAGFTAFNRGYFGVLQEWGVVQGEENPVARSHVCPEIAPPSEPSFHAFSYTVEDAHAPPSFCIAGSGEAREGGASYRENIVAFGDTSAEGMRQKCAYVLGEMERRMAALGFAWTDTTAVQAYTLFDFSPHFLDMFVRRGAARHGLTWQACRPPVEGLDFEMDCRGVAQEIVLSA
jgi:hypothetical protein